MGFTRILNNVTWHDRYAVRQRAKIIIYYHAEHKQTKIRLKTNLEKSPFLLSVLINHTSTNELGTQISWNF